MPSSSVHRARRLLLTSAGIVCVALAVAGIFLPLLPTTPLLLLAAACFTRSSPRLERWLMEHRTLGRYIRDYREGRGMPLRAKATALAVLWGTIALSVYLVNTFWVHCVLLVVGVGVSAHLLMIKTSR